MESAETTLATAFRGTGTLFLRFYQTVLKGEAPDARFGEEQGELVRSVDRLVEVVRQRAPDLRTQERENVHDGHDHPSLREEVDAMATGMELSARSMERLGASVPSMEESENLRPLAPLRDRLKEIGNRMIVIAGTFEEIERVAQGPHPSPLHLVRTEDRLAHLLQELDELMRISREGMQVAIVELRLSVKHPGGA